MVLKQTQTIFPLNTMSVLICSATLPVPCTSRHVQALQQILTLIDRNMLSSHDNILPNGDAPRPVARPLDSGRGAAACPARGRRMVTSRACSATASAVARMVRCEMVRALRVGQRMHRLSPSKTGSGRRMLASTAAAAPSARPAGADGPGG